MGIDINLFEVAFDRAHQRFLAEAVRAFNSCQNEYRLLPQTGKTPFAWRRTVEWETACATFHESDCSDQFTIVVTGIPLKDHYFLHCDGKFGVISTHEWFRIFSPPSLESFLLMEFAIIAACQTVGQSEGILGPHEKSIGCAGDLCEWKPDILLKLRAGHVCPEHREHLRQLGAAQAQISAMEKILNVTRAYALGREEEKRHYGAYTGTKVFVVHGRDMTPLRGLERLLRAVRLHPVAIMDEPSGSQTLIELIEEHSDVGYAFMLFTPDDEGKLSGTPDLCPRPRQNVVFEYGFFVGLLGRRRVCCIVKEGDIELPSDLAGVRQLRYGRSVADIKRRVVEELRHAGFDVSLPRRRRKKS